MISENSAGSILFSSQERNITRMNGLPDFFCIFGNGFVLSMKTLMHRKMQKHMDISSVFSKNKLIYIRCYDPIDIDFEEQNPMDIFPEDVSGDGFL